MKHSNPLDEALRRWRAEHPIPPARASMLSPGYKPCAVLGCPTTIERSQIRSRCFFHGGKPNDHLDSLWEDRFARLKA